MKTFAPEWLAEVPGATELFEWFGFWPSFHDAEVLSISLTRTGASIVRVHTFETTDKVDAKGYFVSQKHVVVSFLLEDVSTCDLAWFNNQNALFGMTLTRVDDGFELNMRAAYGVSGSITARSIRVEIAPGIPDASQYKE